VTFIDFSCNIRIGYGVRLLPRPPGDRGRRGTGKHRTSQRGGQQGHQIIADAKDASGATALAVVQWLRFGGSAYLQMVGIARAEAWKDAYPRFRSVRDGIDPK